MRSTWKIALVALALAGLVTSVGAADKWLHVKIEENGKRGENVDINIPLSVVETMLPLIHVDGLQHGKLRLDDHDLEGLDLRELAEALRETPDTNFVTVQSDDESVRVAKENGFLVVRVEDRGGRSEEKVRVRIPLAIVDALVGGDPHELDLAAALRVLSEYEGDALVDVESDEGSVRVWIDSSESAR